jgi:hypothetical protein
VVVTIGDAKVAKQFRVEEDPRITWFSAADRTKRRAVIDELVEMTRQADVLRKRFTAADSGLTSLQTAWKKPDAPKVPEDVKKLAEALKKTLDDLRPTFATRNFFEPPSAEERKAELLKPEPDFVLPALMGRVNGAISELESFSAAPAESDLKQVAVIKAAVAEAEKKVETMRAEVVKFNEAMAAAKVPYISVQ